MATYAKVVVPPLPQAYTYEVPPELEARMQVGLQVIVPLGHRKAQGYVIASGIDREELGELKYQIKPIHSHALLYPIFLPSQLRFFEWIAAYYGSSLSQVIDCAIPAFVPAVQKQIFQKGSNDELPKKLGQKQQSILEYIGTKPEGVDGRELRARFSGFTQSSKKLIAQGLLHIASEEERTESPFASDAPSWAKRSVDLNSFQQEAVSKVQTSISANRFQSFLLHGITGSGKTEVYIALIEEALRQQKGALVIVPEIALTPQLFDRFQARLGNAVAMLHSGLSRRHRWEFWRGLLENRYQVAMGARSAVFAPVVNLGVIIVDEEHDSSFKQAEGLRYHGRDLAIVRGQFDSVPVVLGSATPSLESYENVKKGKYEFLELPSRFGSSTPASIEVVNIGEIPPWEMISPHISPRLFAEMTTALQNKEQTFLLYNRRGFASYLYCNQCGESLGCPHCSVTLTYHRGRQKLQCHYCGFEQRPPKAAHECSPEQLLAAIPKRNKEKEVTPGFVEAGAGTEKIVDEIQALFPNARVERLDRDSAKNTRDLTAILQRVRDHEIDILVGTQMIAKGHDIPNVTLVGIVDADVGLHMPDFRASERAFQLLTQVAGRAGRSSKPGRVILQSRTPLHPAIIHAQSHDYRAFAEGELHGRRTWAYPPFQRLLRIVVSAEDPNIPMQQLRLFREKVQEWVQTKDSKGQGHIHILGPASAPIERVKGLYRAHLLCKTGTSKELTQIIRVLQAERPLSKNARIIFDHDPQDML